MVVFFFVIVFIVVVFVVVVFVVVVFVVVFFVVIVFVVVVVVFVVVVVVFVVFLRCLCCLRCCCRCLRRRCCRCLCCLPIVPFGESVWELILASLGTKGSLKHFCNSNIEKHKTVRKSRLCLALSFISLHFLFVHVLLLFEPGN